MAPVSAVAGAPAGSRCLQKAPAAHWITGWLHVCGTTILDQAGHRVRLTGIEVSSLGWGAGPADPRPPCGGTWRPPPSFAYPDIATWGFNSVELFISWANLEPVPPSSGTDGTVIHHWDDDYLAELDRAIAGFRAHGVAVVLSMLQSRWSASFKDISFSNGLSTDCGAGMPAWLYPRGGGARAMVKAEERFFQNEDGVQSQFLDAWRFIARRYVGDSTVVGVLPLFEAYDVLTQPYPGASALGPADLHLARFFERVARAVHAINPRLLVMVTEQRSRTTRRWALTRRPHVPNGVLTTEFYAGNWIPNGLRRLSDHQERALRWDMPMWIDEFSAFNRTLDFAVDPNWKRDTRALLAHAKAHGIGWALCGYAAGGFQRENAVRRPKPGLLPILRAGF